MNKVSSAVERVKDVFQGWHILQWVCMGVWILAVIIIGIMSMKVSSARDQFEVEYAQNAATISSLRTELESFDNAKQNDADEIKVTAKSAYTAGVKVANGQNRLLVDWASDDMTALSTHKGELRQYFDETCGIGAAAWFYPGTVEQANLIKWTFVTSLESTAQQFDVLWLLQDSKGLVAYATGVYHTNTELFSDIVIKNTSYGAAYVGTFDENDSYGDIPNEAGYSTVTAPVDIPAGVTYDATTGQFYNADGSVYQSDIENDDTAQVWAGEFQDEFADDFADAVSRRAANFGKN